MWIFTPIGFFSVVADERASTQLVVRARALIDLKRLAREFPCKIRIVTTPHADYPFRASVPRAEFGLWLGRTATEIDYGNFKNEVAKKDHDRAHGPYLEIWSILRRFLDKRRNDPVPRG